MQNASDEQLMLDYQNGESRAMDEFLRRYKNPIYHFALRLSRDEAEAQDIAQEVFARLHEFRHSYKHTAKFSTWLFSICHNLCVSRFRKRKWQVLWPRQKDDPDELVEFESPDPIADEAASQNELTGILKKCLQGLPFLQREALVLREYQNLDYAEISKILHVSLGKVKTLIHRARLRLKDQFLPYVEEVEGGRHV